MDGNIIEAQNREITCPRSSSSSGHSEDQNQFSVSQLNVLPLYHRALTAGRLGQSPHAVEGAHSGPLRAGPFSLSKESVGPEGCVHLETMAPF